MSRHIGRQSEKTCSDEGFVEFSLEFSHSHQDLELPSHALAGHPYWTPRQPSYVHSALHSQGGFSHLSPLSPPVPLQSQPQLPLTPVAAPPFVQLIIAAFSASSPTVQTFGLHLSGHDPETSSS